MAREVTVPARKAFFYRGRMVQPGEHVTMRPVEAAVRARRQEVSLTPVPGYVHVDPDIELAQKAVTEAATVEPTPDPVPEPEAPFRRRRYSRRDMVAEDSGGSPE